MIRSSLSIYFPSYPKVLVYMLQSSEYQVWPYLKWLWRTKDYSTVMKRRQLQKTKATRLLLAASYGGISAQIMAGLICIFLESQGKFVGGYSLGGALILLYPIVWAHLLVLPLALGRLLITGPEERQLIAEATSVFANHKGVKIAVVGSYGKTTMKELLQTVLSEGLNVVATPANKNVAISHARFAKHLTGKEDILVLEYGEGAPGDIAELAKQTKPDYAVITGLAPAHLDHYKTVHAAGQDLFSIAETVAADRLYVNADSPETKPFLQDAHQSFDHKSALGWKVSAVKTDLSGTSFTLKKGSKSLRLTSALIGQHHVGFLAFVAAFGLLLGLTEKQIIAGIAATKPFEHRMQPLKMGGAWVIDDTYNGNLEGIRAGTTLIASLQATRKWYVTPGLVDQGDQTEAIHTEVGELIAAAQPDIVVLMKNSVTDYIRAGLQKTNFKGELRIEENPLEFYTNLKHQVAEGDVVLMQNDWTDNYA